MFFFSIKKIQDQDKIDDRFNVTAGWKKFVDGKREEMGDTVCAKYRNLL